MFVISSDRTAFGVGKVIDPEESPGRVQYFVSPADEPIEEDVHPDTLTEVELLAEERVFFLEDETWRHARFVEYLGPDELGVKLPGGELRSVSIDEAFVRSSIQISSPLGLLQTRNNETRFWYEGRTRFLRSVVKQRAAYHGMTGLASSSVEVFRHQLNVTRRVLNDPVPRYILADEVGLGKTIEAGIIIRQHILDHGVEADVLILVPEHLVSQWRQELTRFFYLDASQVTVMSHQDDQLLSLDDESFSLIVIDEAHQVARHAFGSESEVETYGVLSDLTQRSPGVLLLSATPVLHNEDAYLAMLCLLDPDAHSLDDRDGFRQRIKHRDVIASAIRDLDEDSPSYVLADVLKALEHLSDGNPELATLLTEVESTKSLRDSPDRGAAIVKLRSHLHEGYRLDRRLLRTRREQPSVRDDLPTRTYQEWIVDDAWRHAHHDWLDQWRFNAVQGAGVEACKDVFTALLRALMQHPVALSRVVAERLDAIEAGGAPLFENEREYLREMSSCAMEDDPRVKSLSDIAADDPAKKWVVFVSDSDVADQLAETLSNTTHTSRVDGSCDPNDVIRRFRSNDEAQVIICDMSGEEGLNLQGLNASAVHFDLPMSAVRIEQRIGRLDRLGGDPEVVSLVSVTRSDDGTLNYESAWARCLIDSVGVFNRSVASLQHALDSGESRLADVVADHGVEAITDLAAEWGASDGPHSLEQERRLVENQDYLDQIEMLESETVDVYDEIEQYEYPEDGKRSDRFARAVESWAVRSLHFAANLNPETDAVEYRHTRKTLIPVNRFARFFAASFRRDDRKRGLTSGPLHFDRPRAAAVGLPLARVGHPFVNDLRRLTRTDDRGRAYACWRMEPDFVNKFGTGNPVDLYFGFNFLVEANLDIAQSELPGQLSVDAVARRLEGCFAPFFSTIWVGVEAERIRDPELIEALERRYDRHTDTNLRDARWDCVDQLSIYADWSALCQQACDAANKSLVEDHELHQRVDDACDAVKLRLAEVEQQMMARISSFGDNGRDRRILELEQAVHERMEAAIRTPEIRLDSVGAVFLSSINPFRGMR